MSLRACRRAVGFGSSRRWYGGATHDAVVASMQGWSIEVTPKQAASLPSFKTDAMPLLPPSTAVNVTCLPGSDPAESVHICERLCSDGLRAVAHVPARNFASLSAVEEYLAALSGVGVREVLVLGGGAPRPAGDLTETMQILESGLLEKYGISKVGVAAHPEGHPDIDDATLVREMARKALWAEATGTELYFETQFCFEAAPVLRWEAASRKALREAGAGKGSQPLPRVRLGVAGPAKISSLIKFGTMSGVGASLNFLTKHAGSVFKLATTQAPDELVGGVAAARAKAAEAAARGEGASAGDDDGDCLIDSFHFYPFGGFKATLRWVDAVSNGKFQPSDHGVGFQVIT